MPNWNIKYLYNAAGYGWEEEWYIVSEETDPRELSQRILTVASARGLFMGSGVVWKGFRVVNVDNVGQSWFSPVGPGSSAARTVSVAADQPTTAVVIRFNGGNFQYRRLMSCRGIPDLWVFRSPTTLEMTWTDDITTAVTSYTNAIKAAGFRLHVISKLPADVNLQKVQDVTYAASVTTVTAAAHGYAVGDTVRISGVRGTAALVAKGVYQIKARTLDTFSFPAVDPGVPVFYLKGGRVRRQVLTYSTVDEGFVTRVSKKDTGKAFFLPVGRRRRR